MVRSVPVTTSVSAILVLAEVVIKNESPISHKGEIHIRHSIGAKLPSSVLSIKKVAVIAKVNKLKK